MVGDRPYMGIPQWWILSLRVDAIKNWYLDRRSWMQGKDKPQGGVWIISTILS
jgi:hypothetical protein